MSFDQIAPWYRLLETVAFGGALQRARVCWLGRIPRPNRVLIAGEGNGRFLCELLRLHPRIDIDCVDASARMLELARARVRKFHPASLRQVRFFHQDISNFQPPDFYDLLVTHFFLDCFLPKQIEAIVARLASAARPGAIWLLADFAIPRRAFARIRARIWLRLMYTFFRISAAIPAHDLVDPSRFAQNNSFTLGARKLFRSGMLKSEWYSKGTGEIV